MVKKDFESHLSQAMHDRFTGSNLLIIRSHAAGLATRLFEVPALTRENVNQAVQEVQNQLSFSNRVSGLVVEEVNRLFREQENRDPFLTRVLNGLNDAARAVRDFFANTDWARVARGVALSLAGTGSIILGKGAIASAAAAATTIIAATGGVLAPVAIPLTIGIGAWGVATIVSGASNLVEGLLDIVHGLGFPGLSGDVPPTSFNFLRDVVFSGDQVLANIVNMVLMNGSSAIITLGMFSGGSNQNNNQNADWENQTERKANHTDVHGRSGDLPPTAAPNSSQDLFVNGKLWQRRFFGSDGRMIMDIDFYHNNPDAHTFPHRHFWDWSTGTPRRYER